jgi:DNA-directed RNA polymerase specialized sigma24 family protein
MGSVSIASIEGASVRFRTTACSGTKGGGLLKPSVADEGVEELVAQACTGDEIAWQALWARLDPWLDALVARRALIGRLSRRDDDRRGVVVLVMARLRQHDFQRLRMYQSERVKKPSLALKAWLTVVAKHVAIDYLRAHPDFMASGSRAASERRGDLVQWKTLPPASRGPATRPQVTREISAHQMLEWAQRNLPGDQYRALELRMARDIPDMAIARDMGLSGPEEAQRLIRAAEARLRRQFRGLQELP